MTNIEIEIDGKKLQARPDATIIQVADEAGIYIPRFCYHKHLSIAANCRMCLVEVEKSPKTLPACATPVTPGMKVFTRSPKAIAAQKAVMEFLLINHPLDCPICDQGGECELQDLSMGYGSAESYYHEGKRTFKDKNIGPLIATDMTRCIQCTRCVRFGSEVAGFRELGATGRGEEMEIGTYIQHAMQSEVSGNIIDLCPVGALTSKPFRFTARAWELQQYPSIAPHDCLGSNINIHTRWGKVMRVVPRENRDINQTWISDRDRYSYEGLSHPDRLDKPFIRKGDKWQETDWQTALQFTAEGLENIKTNYGSEQLAALASPNSTLEEFYLLQKLMRSLGSSNIDHRLRQIDFRDEAYQPLYPSLNMPLNEIDQCDMILLVGAHLQKDQPLASLRVRKAALNGAKVIALNMLDYDFNFKTIYKKIAAPHQFVRTIEEFIEEKAIYDLLKTAKRGCILFGSEAMNHPEAAIIRKLTQKISEECNFTLGFFTEGANAAGAWLAGAIPHRGVAGSEVKLGLDARAVWKNSRKGYLLLNVEPDLDCANSYAAMAALEEAEFVIALTPFRTSLLEQCAHVFLPISAFTETSGTFVNVEGKWQSFQGVANTFGESRPAWKVLRVLANFLHCPDFDYQSTEEIRDKIRLKVDEEGLIRHFSKGVEGSFDNKIENFSENFLSRIGEIPIYSSDNLQRRAKALQAAQSIREGNVATIRIHPKMAEQLKIKELEMVSVKQNQSKTRLPIVFDTRVPMHAALVPGGIPATNCLSELYGPIEINKI